jgi:hypothetical protein
MELTTTYETAKNYYVVLLASGVGSKTLRKSFTFIIPKEGIFSNNEVVSTLRTCHVVCPLFSLQKQLMIFSNFFCKTRNYESTTTKREEKNIMTI